jgi:hypothetical protein
MRRTRKWSYVAQEATRLADIGLAPVEIATRLEVTRSTVQRWMAAGRLTDTRHGARTRSSAVQPKSAAEWAAAVRAAYALDATDEELVTMGEAALRKVHDPRESPQVQLNAMGRFLAIVKQLALVARAAEATAPVPIEEPKTAPAASVRRPGVDPRNLLQAVK